MDMSKYKFYTNNENTIVAVSSYAGRPVRGVAKCDPRDSFDFASGEKLAAARCNVKVAEKRAKRAERKYAEALAEFNAAQKNLIRMTSYCTEAEAAVNKAHDEVAKIRSKM